MQRAFIAVSIIILGGVVGLRGTAKIIFFAYIIWEIINLIRRSHPLACANSRDFTTTVPRHPTITLTLMIILTRNPIVIATAKRTIATHPINAYAATVKTEKTAKTAKMEKMVKTVRMAKMAEMDAPDHKDHADPPHDAKMSASRSKKHSCSTSL